MSEDRVVLLLTGDVMLGGEFSRLKDEMGLTWEYPFEDVRPFFKDADIRFVNLECPLFMSKKPRDKNCLLYAPVDSISALKHLHYDVVSLGNNHITDQGDEPAWKTIEVLKDSGIACVGAGRNYEEVEQGVIIERKGLRFAFFSYTTPDYPAVQSIMAGPKNAGCVLYDIKRIERDVRKSGSDVVCISLHWGYEYHRYPSPEQIDLAHQIIDVGAHIIIGHHPHVVQGFERYKDGIIFYSLGNFLLSDFRRRNGVLHRYPKGGKEFILARCEIRKSKIERVEIIPGFMRKDYRLIVWDGNKKKKAIAKIGRLSERLKRDDYERFWRTYNTKMENIDKENYTKDLLWTYFERSKELGVMGCIGKVSLRKIKYIIYLLFKYLRTITSKSDFTL